MQEPATQRDDPPRRGSRFAVWLLLVALVGLGVRVTFAAGNEPGPGFSDAVFYQGAAENLANGRGFMDPYGFALGRHPGPAAQHPPLTAIVLTPVAAVFPDDARAMRITFALVGTIGVVLIGLLGAAVRNERTGLVAAGVAALYPYLWVNDGVVMSESLAVVLTTATLLATYRYLRRPGTARAVLVGVLCGLAALARAELLLLGLLVPLGIWFRSGLPRRPRAIAGAVVLVTSLLVVTPWIAFNLSRFERPVLMTTDGDINLMFSNCDASFHGPKLGSGACLAPTARGRDHSVESEAYREQAVDYVRAHLGRFPVVVLARLGRDWSLFRPGQSIVDFEGRPRWVMGLGLVAYYPLLLLAVGGTVVLIRRRRVCWPLLVPPAVVCATALVSWGQPRYRAIAEPCIVVLAAVALDRLVAWRQDPPVADAVTAAPDDPDGSRSSG